MGFHDARAAELFEWIVSEAKRRRCSIDFPMHIVRGKPRKAQGPSLTRPTQVPQVFSFSSPPAQHESLEIHLFYFR